MSCRKSLAVAFALLLATLVFSGCYKAFDYTVVLNEDGSGKIVTDCVVDRATIEAQVAMMGQADEEGDDADAPAPEKDEPAKKDDARLASDIKRSLEAELASRPIEGIECKIDKVEVKGDDVHLVTTASFKEIKALVGAAPRYLMGAGLRIEKDDKGKLRLALSSSPGTSKRYGGDAFEQSVEGQKIKLSFTLVAPGKIISSTLPTTKDNSTSIALDSDNKDSVEAFKKFVLEGAVVVAEPGKLALDTLPLDSAELASFGRPDSNQNADLPLVDAVPGYTVKPLAVTTNTVHRFDLPNDVPAGRLDEMIAGEGNSCVVQARLFPPQTRQIMSLESVRLLKALDDKKREVKAPGGDAGDYHGATSYYGGGDAHQAAALQIRTALPEPDAQALEEIQAEAVVVSFARWKEHVLGEPKADPKAVIDLSDALPGASMIVKSVKTPKPEGDDGDGNSASRQQVVVEITGPPSVKRLDFQIRSEAGAERDNPGSVYPQRERVSQSGGKTVRSLTLEIYNYSSREDKAGRILVIRYPDDIKRERVKFTLEAIDLF